VPVIPCIGGVLNADRILDFSILKMNTGEIYDPGGLGLQSSEKLLDINIKIIYIVSIV